MGVLSTNKNAKCYVCGGQIKKDITFHITLNSKGFVVGTHNECRNDLEEEELK